MTDVVRNENYLVHSEDVARSPGAISRSTEAATAESECDGLTAVAGVEVAAEFFVLAPREAKHDVGTAVWRG